MRSLIYIIVLCVLFACHKARSRVDVTDDCLTPSTSCFPLQDGGEVPEDVGEVPEDDGERVASQALDSFAQPPDVPHEEESTDDVLVQTAGLPDGLHGVVPPYDAPLEGLTGVLDQSGEPVGIDQLRESWMVLWFFPKASSFG